MSSRKSRTYGGGRACLPAGCLPSLPSSTQGSPGDSMEQLLLTSPRGLVKPPLAEALLRGDREIGRHAATVAYTVGALAQGSAVVLLMLIQADPWAHDLPR